jgi:hypothetical protein
MKEDIVKDSGTESDERPRETFDGDQKKTIMRESQQIPGSGKVELNNLNTVPEISRERDEDRSLEARTKEERPGTESLKLPKGKIPASPDLTRKIANVIQLENKLKRRKYELEKKERESRDRKLPEKGEPVVAIEMDSSDIREPDRTTLKSDKKERIERPPEPPVIDEKVTQVPVKAHNVSPHRINTQENDGPEEGPIDKKSSSPQQNGPQSPQPSAVRRRMIIRRRPPPPTRIKEREPARTNNQDGPPGERSSPSNQELDTNQVKTQGALKTFSKLFRKGNE